MKKIVSIILITMYAACAAQPLCAQGWRAIIELSFGSGVTPLERIDHASVTISGVTVHGWSSASDLRMELSGPGTPMGPIHIYASGPSVWNPQMTSYINVTSSMHVTGDCDMQYLDADPAVNQYVFGTVTVYPRLRITDVAEACDGVTVATTICSDGPYTWDIAESLSGPFRVLTGTRTSNTKISGDQLVAMGLSRYGRKFIRVTGGANTTSPVEVIDFFPPGPSTAFSLTAPTCHDGKDGSITINMTSVLPDIDDFIIAVQSVAPLPHFSQFQLENSSTFTVDSLKAGVYRIQITNHSNTEINGQCWTEFEVGSLPNPPQVVISAFDVSDYNGYPITCQGGQDGSITAHPSGGTGSFQEFSWTPDVSETSSAVNLPEGRYTVRVKDSNACWSDEYEKILIAPEKLSLGLQSVGGLGGFDVSCHDKNDGTITAISSGGVPHYSFSWSTGAETSSLTGVPPGSYHATTTDANGCAASAFITLRAPEPINFSIAEIAGINCAGDRTGALEVQSVVNTIGQTYYSWSSGETGRELVNQGSGMYSVTVSDDQGCMETQSRRLDDPPAHTVNIIPQTDFHGSPIKCHGESNGKLLAVVHDENGNRVPGEYYAWQSKEGEVLDEGISQISLDQVGAGTYSVRVTYRTVCEAQTQYTLHEPERVSPIILTETDYNGTAISCKGASDGTLRAMASGGTGDAYQYVWSSGASLQTITGLSAGDYSVTVADINGCEGGAVKTLREPDSVGVHITIMSNYNGQPLTCADASDARLRGSAHGGTPAFDYLWSTGHVTSELTDVPAGHYTLTAIDANGCQGTAEATIINPDPVGAEIAGMSDFHGFGVSCNGAADGFLSASASGGTGVYVFDWNDGAHSNPRFENLPAGRYTVRIADQNGCYGATATSILEPPPLELSITNFKNISCHSGDDGEIQLAPGGGAGDYTYAASGLEWQQESLLTSLRAGVHQVLVQDANGCQQNAHQQLTEPSALSIQFKDIEPALCGDARGKVSANVSGGSEPYQYAWRDARGQWISDSPHLSNLTAGVYTLNVEDQHACETIQSVGITSTDGPQIKVSQITPPTCSYTSDGSALVDITEGDGPFTFLWDDGQQTAEAVNLRKGNYLVKVTDANQCSAVQALTLSAPDSMDIMLLEKREPLCHGDCNGSLLVAAQGGNGGYHYDWGSSQGPTLTDLCAGAYNVHLTDAKGCIAEKSILLAAPDPLAIRLMSLKPPTCQDGCDGSIETRAVGGTGPIRYNWSNANETPQISSLCPGTYTLTVEDENQCTTAESFVVLNPAEDHLDLGGPMTLCEGQTHILDPGNFWKSYSWTSNTGLVSNLQRVTVTDAGMYSLEAVSSKGCIVRDTFFLETSRDLLKANFLLATEGMTDDTVVMIDISWPLPENSLWHLPREMDRLLDHGDIVYGQFAQAGQYDISLATTLGECRDEITKTITILDDKTDTEGGRLGHAPLVKEFSLFPNPNDGKFDVRIVLSGEHPVTLTIWNMLTAMPVARIEEHGQSAYIVHVDLRPLSAGNYTLRMDHLEGTAYLRFIVR